MPIKPNPSQTPEIDVLRKVYAAINRNDIAAALEFLDPQVVRIEPEGFPSAGIYRGHEEVKAHLTKGRSTWAEGACEPERFLAAGEKVVVFLHVRVRLNGKSEWIDSRFADGFVFRGNQIIEMRTFGERKDALHWAGITGA